MSQRASATAGWKLVIQIMCQVGAVQKLLLFQSVAYFAVHQVDGYSCLFERHKLKPYAANRDA
jgi:hypothetical protein